MGEGGGGCVLGWKEGRGFEMGIWVGGFGVEVVVLEALGWEIFGVMR